MPAIIIISVVLALLIIYLIISWSYFKLAIKRTVIEDMCTKEGIAKLKLTDYEEILLKGREQLENTEYEKAEIKSFDGLTLRGRFYTVPNARATVIFFHGYRSSPMIEFTASFNFYRKRNINVLLVHQRAHGESEGKYVTFGVKERRDVYSWIDFVKSRLGEDTKIFLSGVSMGSATILMGAGLGYPENVKGLIADCGFTSPYEILEHVVKTYIKIPFKPLIYTVNFMCKKLAGFDLREYSTIEGISNCKLPILFVHGKADDFVPPHMTQRNYDSYQGEKILLLVEAAGHGYSYLINKEEYQEQIENLILNKL